MNIARQDNNYDIFTIFLRVWSISREYCDFVLLSKDFRRSAITKTQIHSVTVLWRKKKHTAFVKRCWRFWLRPLALVARRYGYHLLVAHLSKETRSWTKVFWGYFFFWDLLKIGQNREISKGYTLWPLFGQIINYFLFNFNLFVLKVYVVLKVSFTVVHNDKHDPCPNQVGLLK